MRDPGTIYFVRETTSTNELAKAALAEGAPEGTTFVADRQRAGRGRVSEGGSRKSWHSPPGKNLYFSVVLRPKVAVERLAAITLAVGVALVESLRDQTDADIWLKWPNDLYIGDRKLGGVLTEGVTGVGGVEGVVVGVGINVNMKASDFPPELSEIATSLEMETGVVQDRLLLAPALIEALVAATREYVAGGLEVFRGRIERFDRLKGRRVEVQQKGEPWRGRALRIGESGGLEVISNEGKTREVMAGEVIVDGLGGVVLNGE